MPSPPAEARNQSRMEMIEFVSMEGGGGGGAAGLFMSDALICTQQWRVQPNLQSKSDRQPVSPLVHGRKLRLGLMSSYP